MYAVILISYTSAISVRMKVVISCCRFLCDCDPGIQNRVLIRILFGEVEFMIIWSSNEAYVVDALAARGDEGRCRLRKASGSSQTCFDPEVSEWGNPPDLSGIVN